MYRKDALLGVFVDILVLIAPTYLIEPLNKKSDDGTLNSRLAEEIV